VRDPASLGRGRVFGMADGKKLATFSMGDKGSVCWSPDGRFLCVTDSDGTVAILSATGGKPLHTLPQGVDVEAGACAFSPCGRLLAVAGFHRTRAEGWGTGYETATGTPRPGLKGARGKGRALAFSHDWRWVST